MSRAFISYPSEYLNWALWVSEKLTSIGYQVYVQEHSAEPGVLPGEHIAAQLEQAHLFCYISGPHFFASKWCRQELEWFNYRMNSRGMPQSSVEPSSRRIIALLVEPAPDAHIIFPGPFGHIDLTRFPAPSDDAAAVLLAHLGRIDMQPPPAAKKIIPNFDNFLHEIQSDDGFPGISSLPTGALTREPNFLIFSRSEQLTLAIIDKSSRVDPRSLQRTDEEQVEAKLYGGPIDELGFDSGFVHPIFEDPNDLIARIVVDASLWFQFLYFPASLIRIPVVRFSEPQKLDMPISLFFSYLYRFHSSKILIANIFKGKWNDTLLLDRMRKSDCFTRFAPTPTGSLHLGNIRSALIPYLLYRKNVRANLFFLRIDDTSITDEAPVLIAQNTQELEWLGFRAERRFSESSPQQQILYKQVMILLQRCQYVLRRGGTTVLNWDHPELSFGAWMDVATGPVVFHSAPMVLNRKSRKREFASLILSKRDGFNDHFTYKFCGVVDDLLFSTHVVRDIRQKHNTLTSRQAMIAHAIRQAWERADSDPGARAARDHILQIRTQMLRGLVSPLPFLAPPIYIHVPVVRDHNGKILSKRDRLRGNMDSPNGHFFVETAQYRDLRLPETIVSYLLSTLVPFENRSAIEHRRTLGRMAGELGARVLIDILASKTGIDWYRRSTKDIRVSTVELDEQERFVLRGLTYFQFFRHVRSSCEQMRAPVPSDDLLKRLYSQLKEYASWKEVMAIATYRRQIHQADLPVFKAYVDALEHSQPSTFLATFEQRLGAGVVVNEACASVRVLLTGLPKGVPLFLLGQVLNPEFSELIRRAEVDHAI